MTLLSLRKLRTTVRSTTWGTRAAEAALLALALVAVPAAAQPPGAQSKGLTGGNLAPSAAQPGGLPLPPGYRPRTPPPQAQAQPAPSAPAGAHGSAGRVMYFQKPADALAVTGGNLPAADDGVALVGAPPPALPSGFPDVPPAPVRPAPVSAAPAVAVPPAIEVPLDVPTRYATQPGTTPKTDNRKQNEIPAVDPKEVQLPSRDKIFGAVYNDRELERAIMDSIRRDQEINNPKNPLPPETLVFPTLPEVSPRGVAYQPKTAGYAPRAVHLEPGYVVHRRLHFEEKNAERAGWDLGPLSTLASAAHFYRGALLFPGSLATGFTSGFWDTSAGKCVPGGLSPYYLYPPGLSTTGWLTEIGVITGFAFLLQ